MNLNNTDKKYHDLVNAILEKGKLTENRTGINTKSIFGTALEFNLQEGFPLLTTKKVHYPGIVHELLWFLNAMPEKYTNPENKLGNTNIKYLVDNNIKIWTEWPFQHYVKVNNINCKPGTPQWHSKMIEFTDNIKNSDDFAREWGNLGPVYGKQWVDWEENKPLTISAGQSTRDGSEIREGTFIRKRINQIENVINTLKNNPDDRRIIVNAWNVGDLDSVDYRTDDELYNDYLKIVKSNN